LPPLLRSPLPLLRMCAHPLYRPTETDTVPAPVLPYLTCSLFECAGGRAIIFGGRLHFAWFLATPFPLCPVYFLLPPFPITRLAAFVPTSNPPWNSMNLSLQESFLIAGMHSSLFAQSPVSPFFLFWITRFLTPARVCSSRHTANYFLLARLQRAPTLLALPFPSQNVGKYPPQKPTGFFSFTETLAPLMNVENADCETRHTPLPL